MFFKHTELVRIVKDFSREVLLDVDPRSDTHLNFSYLKMKVGVCDADVIRPFRKH
jgi:hypothetical protein